MDGITMKVKYIQHIDRYSSTIILYGILVTVPTFCLANLSRIAFLFLYRTIKENINVIF